MCQQQIVELVGHVFAGGDSYPAESMLISLAKSARRASECIVVIDA